MTSDPIVYVVDDDPTMRESLACLLDVSKVECQVFESAERFLIAYDARRPACLLLDLRMPGMSGLELQEALAERGSQLRIIMLTGHGDVPAAVAALKKGAVDFLQKPFDPNRLLELVHDALEKSMREHANDDRTADISEKLATLSPRERDVLKLIVAGEPTKNIARALGTSFNTVKNQRASILRKLGVDSVVDAVRMVAVRDDW